MTSIRYVGAILVSIALLSCGAVPTGNSEVDELVDGLCREHGSLCVSTQTKEALGFDAEAESVYWGRASYGEIEASDVEVLIDEGIPVDFSARVELLACYEHDRCADDLVTCAGVVLHEIGHQQTHSSDQTDADCWAAQHATEDQLAALQELVCSFREPGRCAALLECSP